MSDAGLLSAAVGASGYNSFARPGKPEPGDPRGQPRYYQCTTRGLNTACSPLDTHNFNNHIPDVIVEVPSVLPTSADYAYVRWRLRCLSKVKFTVSE